MARYVLTQDPAGDTCSVYDREAQHAIPADPDNRDYAAYLEWVAEGNTPDPVEPA